MALLRSVAPSSRKAEDAWLGYTDTIKILLEVGVPWNAFSPSNLFTASSAMDSGHQEAFEALLDAGTQAEIAPESNHQERKQKVVILTRIVREIELLLVWINWWVPIAKLS